MLSGVVMSRARRNGSEERAPRYPLRALKGPSFWWLWQEHREVADAIHAEEQDIFRRMVRDRMDYVLRKFGTGGIH